MAESSSQKTSSSEITPKEEPVALDKLESPNPFLPASQVDFTFDEITFTTNNEVALLAQNQYKENLSEDWYTTKTLDDSKVWISSPTGGVKREIGITTFRNALRAQYLPHSSMYVPPPFIIIVRPWFSTIGYRGEIGAKVTLKKSFLPPRWRLLITQIMQCLGGKTGGLDQISNKDATILYCLANGVQVDYAKIIWEDLIHKLNKKTKEKIVPYPRFLSFLLEHVMPEYENEELTINPTQVFSVHNLTLKPNQPKEPPFTNHMKAICKLDVPMDSKALKPSLQTEEAQQAAGSPTYLGATSEEGAHPQLSSGSNPSVLVDKTKSARDGLKTAHIDSGVNEESRADDISLKVKLEDLSDILKDTRSAFFTPDSPPDEPIILTELLVTSLKPELSKLLASHDFASCLLTELKELPLKITRLSREIKELKKHVRDIEIELPGDLKEIPTKLETFTFTISSLSSQIAELKNIQWELLVEFLNLPSQVSSVQEKLKTLDSLPSLLYKVTNTLNRFATMVENASGATSMNVPSAGKATASPAEGEKNTKDAETNLQKQLIKLDLHPAEWREVVQACPDRREKKMEIHLWIDKDKNGIP
ncbi:hypothetical protein Tco_0593922 [Tanacetum coccineum]